LEAFIFVLLILKTSSFVFDKKNIKLYKEKIKKLYKEITFIYQRNVDIVSFRKSLFMTIHTNKNPKRHFIRIYHVCSIKHNITTIFFIPIKTRSRRLKNMLYPSFFIKNWCPSKKSVI